MVHAGLAWLAISDNILHRPLIKARTAVHANSISLPGTCSAPWSPAGYFVLSFCQAVFTFAARLMHSTAPTVQQRLADATGHSEPDAITPPQSSASGAGKPASLADVVSPWAPSGSGVNLPDASEWLCT